MAQSINKYYWMLVVIAAFAYIATIFTAGVLHIQMLNLATYQPHSVASGINTYSFSWYYVLAFVVEIVIFTIIIKYIKTSWLQWFYKSYSYILVGLATFYLINVYVALVAPLYSFFISLAGIGIILYLFYKYRTKLFNVFGMIIVVGMGSVLGLIFTPLVAMVLLGVFAVYDYISVFRTKTMLKMANSAVSMDKPAPLMFITGNIDAIIKKFQEVRCLNCDSPMNVKRNGKTIEYLCSNCKRNSIETNGKITLVYKGDNVAKVSIPKTNGALLGLGDIMIPSVVMSAYIIQGNILWAFVLVGAIIGLIANMFWINKIKKAIPALPLIFIGIAIMLIIGYAVI